jgi:hypothetical protein
VGNVSIEEIIYSDKSKSWFLVFWNNEGEVFKKLKITSKQFKELKNCGFPKTNFLKSELSK